MKTLMKNLWIDQAGFVLSAELILIASIVLLAMLVGLADIRFSLNQELNDTANGFGAGHHSARYQGLSGTTSDSSGNGSSVLADFCDSTGHSTGTSSTNDSLGTID